MSDQTMKPLAQRLAKQPEQPKTEAQPETASKPADPTPTTEPTSAPKPATVALPESAQLEQSVVTDEREAKTTKAPERAEKVHADAPTPMSPAELARLNAAESARQEQEAAARADQLDRTASDDRPFTFLSRLPELNLYVQLGTTRTAQGVDIPFEHRITFHHGVYHATKAEAVELRKHKRFGKMFNESTSVETAALRKAAAEQRERQYANVQQGGDNSMAGNDAQHFRQMQELDRVEQETLVDL